MGFDPTKRYVVHVGFDNDLESNLIKRYAAEQGCFYWWEGLKNDIFKSADTIKYASLVVMWNGLQHGTSLVTRFCKKRNIPTCYVEWGMLPQSTTFLVDPQGFCADSILAKDVSWVTDEDMENLYRVRADLQKRYPLEPGDHILAPLQIENDTQILYYSHYRKMEEFIADVEAMYPNDRIIARPHPSSKAKRAFARAEVSREGEFLEAAAKAKKVVAITSTCLYESAILGVPIQALGDHPLRIQPPHLHEKVLAGALALRIDRTTGSLGKILDRFGIRPR